MSGNPFYQAMGGNTQGRPNFVQFMQQMKGKDPNAMIQELVKKHNISQDQMNAIHQQAKEMAGQMEQFKGMFGF